MLCQKCGAEVTGKFCPYCGTPITAEMRQEQEIINKAGCPQCHSSNIQFKRENHGEQKIKDKMVIVHKTVGICGDCGYTWYPEDLAKQQKQKEKAAKDTNSAFWILGWLLCFPVPLTILITRQKWAKWLKVITIAAAWIFFIGLMASSQKNKDTAKEAPAETVADLPTAEPTPEPTAEPTKEPTPEPVAEEAEAVTTASSEPNSIDESTYLQAYLVLLELELNKQFDDNYRIDTDEESKLISVTAWRPGVTVEALTSDRSAWDTLQKATESTCKAWYEALADSNLEGYHLSLSVANDLNTDRILLTAFDGVTIYDCLAE